MRVRPRRRCPGSRPAARSAGCSERRWSSLNEVEGSVTVGVATHLRKTSEQASGGYGRCAEPGCHTVVSLDWVMADSNPSALSTARAFPGAVPILIDAEADVTLQAAGKSDLPAIVEQCRDPEMIRWTTVPTPPDGYQLRDAEEFLALTAAGWTSGRRLAGPSTRSETAGLASVAASISTSK